MKIRTFNHFVTTLILSILSIFVFCATINAEEQTQLADNFAAPPENFRTGAYWYWMNGHVTKEGVVNDLKAMKKAGINWVILGSDIVSGTDKDFGKVKVFSPEWYEIMHTMLKTTTELDIDVGLFNCPGWSQSGGPWIKPENSMRYLASSETRIKGPAKIEQQLPQPTEHFQDVKVIAVPVADDYLDNLLKDQSAKWTYSDNFASKQGQTEQIGLPEGESFIEVNLPEAKTARSLILIPANTNSDVELQVGDGDSYRTIKRFIANRTFGGSVYGDDLLLATGFNPLVPVTVSFPEVKSKTFRIVFRKTKKNNNVRDIILTATPFVEQYAEKTFAKMSSSAWNGFLWARQPELQNVTVTKPEHVRDISQYMNKEGVLSWDAPEGDWLVLRTGMAPTNVTNTPPSPEGKGLEVDKMSKEHLAMHFDAFIGDIMKRVPAEDRKSLKMVVQDSYETGGQNFTDRMIDEFKERYGYDPVPFFPVYSGHVIGNPDISDRFLWDVRRLVADKVAYDYVGGMREISHKHGLITWLENYGHWGFPGEFLQYGGQSDEVGGEFWSHKNPTDGKWMTESRLASSCAHIYGKQRVHAESFTSSGFEYGRHPAHFKALGDWSFTEGINGTVLTLFIHQPYEDLYPGIDAWFGSEIHRKNTWFGQADVYLQYIKRCNLMLQQGLNVADVAYFIGEDTPKMNGIRKPELLKGYSFDYINAEVIIRDMSVKDGKLVLPHGTSYRVLVLPPMETMTPELLQKIEQLAAEGGVILGPPPSRSPSMKNYPQADEQIRSLARKMWGDPSPSPSPQGREAVSPQAKKREYGKGLILSDMSMEEVFALLNVAPDFSTGSNDPVLYNHRTVDGQEIYFVSNQSDKSITVKPQFRVKGLQPELWDAVTGEMRPLPAFEQKDESTVVPLKLEAYGSAFIVFRKKGSPAAGDVAANFPEPAVRIPANKAWEVRFESDAVKRGPSETVKFAELSDWSQSDDERIRYFSGTAVYTTQITADNTRGKKWELDLGKVSVMAKVKINGKYVGGVWTAPYRLNVTKYLKQGENTIEIEVVNTWVNRIIGDMNLPDGQRKVKPNYNSWRADSPLQSSGLLGPVELLGY